MVMEVEGQMATLADIAVTWKNSGAEYERLLKE
jgi:hypothetical protein